MDQEIARLKELTEKSRAMVFFGGAGVSTESGIPDFRSVDGLYHQQYAFPPETILSHSFFERNPEEFYRFYRSKMLFPQARPNAAHWKLAELEAAGYAGPVSLLLPGERYAGRPSWPEERALEVLRGGAE